MTLTTRLSVFFLAALGVVLVGFSSVLYFSARTYLLRQAEDRLQGALNTLSAAAEFARDGIEWEPQERHMALGPDTGSDAVLWVVSDSQGRWIDSTRASSPLLSLFPIGEEGRVESQGE